MAFTQTSSVRRVPTHIQFLSKEPEKQGIKSNIVRIMYNDDWKTITFFTEEFKLNLKYEDEEVFSSSWNDVTSTLDGKPVKAFLVDRSNVAEGSFDCDVCIEQCVKSKGGREYSWKRGICSFN